MEEMEETEETEDGLPEIEDLEKLEEVEEIIFCDSNGKAPIRNKLIFNEIAWMGSLESFSNEWIELKNISGETINLSGWQILDKAQQIKIVFGEEDIISSNEFYLLERTDNDSVPNIESDFIYTGGLNDTKESIYLFNNNCGLEDKVLASPDWPSGNKNNKKTMERSNNLNWHTFTGVGQNNIWGTPKKENSQEVVYTSSNSSSASTLSLLSEPIAKILINEIQISGQTVKDEFIELYNPNNEDIDLNNWSLKKKTSSGNESSLVSSSSFSGTISSLGYFLIVPQVKDDGSFNYQGEAIPDLYYSGKTYSIAADNTILLYDQNQNLIDKVGFGEVQDFESQAFSQNPDTNQSIGRKFNSDIQEYQDSDNNFQDFEIQEPTPKANNKTIVLVLPQPILEISPENLEFNAEFGINPQEQLLAIINTGDGILEWTGIINYDSPSSDGVAWLGLSSDSGIADSEVSVYSDISGLDEGNYSANITIEAIGAENSPQEVSASLTVSPEPTKEIIINEISWMGTEASSSDEWIELYNTSDLKVDIANWSIYGADTEKCLNFSDANDGINNTIISSNNYLIYANNENSVQDSKGLSIVDIWDATIGMNNSSGGQLILYNTEDCNGDVIDVVNQASGDWLAGNSGNRITMERVNANLSGLDSENWANNNLITKNGKDSDGNKINGTPKEENSVSKLFTEIISGFTINQDIIFTYLGSPYIINGPMYLSNGINLNIEPGVIFKFKSSGKIEIKGNLLAQGTSEKPIIFTSWKDDEQGGDTNNDEDNSLPVPGDWKWISFIDSNSVIENIIVKYGGSSTAGTPSFSRAVIQVEGGEFNISNSIITDNLAQEIGRASCRERV